MIQSKKSVQFQVRHIRHISFIKVIIYLKRIDVVNQYWSTTNSDKVCKRWMCKHKQKRNRQTTYF